MAPSHSWRWGLHRMYMDVKGLMSSNCWGLTLWSQLLDFVRITHLCQSECVRMCSSLARDWRGTEQDWQGTSLLHDPQRRMDCRADWAAKPKTQNFRVTQTTYGSAFPPLGEDTGLPCRLRMWRAQCDSYMTQQGFLTSCMQIYAPRSTWSFGKDRRSWLLHIL